jgi:hypothetical protein
LLAHIDKPIVQALGIVENGSRIIRTHGESVFVANVLIVSANLNARNASVFIYVVTDK